MSVTDTQLSVLENRPPPKRKILDVLAPLDRLSGASSRLFAKPLRALTQSGQEYRVPRYLFIGPGAKKDALRLGLFAGIHGDEPEGTYALIQLLSLLEQTPALAAGYYLFVYPVCNPSGFEAHTRSSQDGHDLNREFWKESSAPEVDLLQRELLVHAFHGLVSLHSDDTSDGIYGYARGATITRYLLEPALAAAEVVLPRNRGREIDGFAARHGIIRRCYDGVLGMPPQLKPRPFEIVFETPQAASQYHQTQASVAALLTILEEYRKFIAYAVNL
jgi:murein peptide amidase A